MSGSPVDAAVLARLASPVRESLSLNAIVVACADAAAAGSSAWAAGPTGMLEAVRAMPREEQQMLLISLYQALPLPGWLRYLIRLFRRAAGVG